MKLKQVILTSLLVLGNLGTIPQVQAVQMIYGGFSKHIGVHEYDYEGETHKLNEVNPTIGVESDDGWGVAVMKNSYYKTSVVMGKSWVWPQTDNFAWGLKLGAVTGYKDTPIGWAVLPFGQVEAQYKVTQRVTMVLGYMPPVQDDYMGVFTLHGKLKF